MTFVKQQTMKARTVLRIATFSSLFLLISAVVPCAWGQSLLTFLTRNQDEGAVPRPVAAYQATQEGAAVPQPAGPPRLGRGAFRAIEKRLAERAAAAASHSAATSTASPAATTSTAGSSLGKRRPVAEALQDDALVIEEPAEELAEPQAITPIVEDILPASPVEEQTTAKDSGAKDSDSDQSSRGIVSQQSEPAVPEGLGDDTILGSMAEPAPLAASKDVSGSAQEEPATLLTPVIEIRAAGPKRIMVGQESSYTITISNNSTVDANGLNVTTTIPDGIEISSIQPTTGMSRVAELAATVEGAHSSNSACLWKIGLLPAGRVETLVINFIPKARCSLDFVSQYDYEKSCVRSDIEVQEPIIELAIEGRDTIDWGVEERYRMILRNTGNGEARNLRLDVATGEKDTASCVLEELLPGEEKMVELNVKTVLEGTLNIEATAISEFGFSSSARKCVTVLRGHLDVFAEVPEMQFVNDTFDYLVHVCNNGQAILQNVEVTAAMPSTIEFAGCTGEGSHDSVSNRVVWKVPSIKPGEEMVYQVTGKMLRPGINRIDLSAWDQTGVTSTSDAEVQVEAIAALEIRINKPNGPIATGSEIDYEVVIANNGTKAAESIDAGFFLPAGMIPLSVEGGGMIQENESKVLFSKINFLGPGQSVSYKVRVRAECGGNQKVQAVLESRPEDVALVAEEMNFFYQRKTLARNGQGKVERVAMRPESAPAPMTPQPQAAPEAQPMAQPAPQPTVPAAPAVPEAAPAPVADQLPAALPEFPLPGPQAP
ncbi:MAG: DUF11 domain-containing protein [Thermoguttaceae bacterium]|nr:DUF11 domain-containing protein [Thermoguttaceae bacterium]